MAVYYLRPGASVNGDGTSPDVAASPGGPGAWNDVLNVLQGTPSNGALNSGDIVMVRPVDESGNDYQLTYSSALTVGKAGVIYVTSCEPWGCSGGRFIFSPNGKQTLTIVAGSHFVGQDTAKWKLLSTGSLTGSSWTMLQSGSLIGWDIDNTQQTSGYGGKLTDNGAGDIYTVQNLDLRFGIYYSRLFGLGNYHISTFDGVRGDFNTALNSSYILVWPGNYGGHVFVQGFQHTGVKAGSDTIADSTSTRGSLSAFGVDGFTTYAKTDRNHLIVGVDKNGVAGRYTYASQGDVYFDPTLPRLTGPSFRLVPSSSVPSRVILYGFLVYNDTEASKTVTVEVLIPTTATANAWEYWIGLAYHKPDGTSGYVHTLDPHAGALTTSSASWNTTTYNGTTYNAYRFQVTTPDAVQGDTTMTLVAFARTNEMIVSTDVGVA